MHLFLLFILLLSFITMVTAMASCLSDRDKDHRLRKNCTGAGLTNIPFGLEPENQVLLFPHNLFSNLSWTSFRTFADIYEIDISANKVPAVTPSTAAILPSLTVLRLGSNLLTSLADGSFSACPGLAELYLDNNAIASLSDNTFSGLSKLEILDLTSNHITVLPDLMLQPLVTIETLYLEHNKVRVMPDNWFSPKEEVPYLYLSANPWACSCSLSYFHTYLLDKDYNVYVRDGQDIKSDVDSVVCDSPLEHSGKPVVSLEESDLCQASTERTFLGKPYWHQTTQPPFLTTTSQTHPPTTLTTVLVPELQTPFYSIVTWSWYQTFTSFFEWSNHSGTVLVGGSVMVPDMAARVITPLPERPTTPAETVRPSTSRPAETARPSTSRPTETARPSSSRPTETARPSTSRPTETARPSTSRPTTTPELVATTTESTTMSQLVRGPSRIKFSPTGGARFFCIWLFAGCLLLSVASAACVLLTLVWLLTWYRRVYLPLRTMARRGWRDGDMRLLVTRRAEEAGVVALYRSVLFIQKEGEGEGGEEGRDEERITPLKPAQLGKGAEGGGEESGREEVGVYRKTLYRLLSREEELEGWREVVEECRVSDRKGDRRRGEAQGKESRKRYSVILREEKEEVGEGVDWVVGGWEATGEGEEPRSSWGEWLAHYLPSMPWRVTADPEPESPQ